MSSDSEFHTNSPSVLPNGFRPQSEIPQWRGFLHSSGEITHDHNSHSSCLSRLRDEGFVQQGGVTFMISVATCETLDKSVVLARRV